MAAWVWLVAYLAGFALLQVLLYRYVANSRGNGTAPTGPEGLSAPAKEPAESGDRAVRCGRCGAPNEAGYTYCRRCAGQL